MRKYYLWLNHLRQMGTTDKTKLLRQLGSPEAVYNEMDAGTCAALVESGALKRAAADEMLDSKYDGWFEEYKDSLRKNEINFVTPIDDDYPERLLDIYDCPLTLFYKGDLSILKEDLCIAVIGARKPTGYGSAVAEAFSETLASNGAVIVSGMAAGIDARAHTGAQKVNGRTAAVLGSGLNFCYPRDNFLIYEKLISDGVIVSEYGPEVSPIGINFPARNRIISGLSDAVLVVEARKRSGTLITADAALEQGRSIYAVPGRIGDPLSEGTNGLIRSGAVCVTGPEDILNDYKAGTEVKIKRKKPDPEITEIERKILNNMSVMPKFIDDLIRETGESVTAVISALSSMKQRGIVAEPVPGFYQIALAYKNDL